MVLSKSDETGEVSYRKVTNTFIRQTEAIYTVSFTDGIILETTWNHPFRVKKQGHALETFSIENTTWVQAKDLHPGDVALGADGQELVITDITIDERVEIVYNFEVEGYHTYFVGEVGVWVHNADKTYSMKKNAVGVDGFKAALVAKDKLLSGEISDKEYEQEMRAIQKGKYLSREIGDEIKYKGIGAPMALDKGKFAYDEDGNVTVVDKLDADPDNWSKIEKLNANHKRTIEKKDEKGKVTSSKTIDQTWRGDVSSQNTWYGPAAKFKVINAGVSHPYGGFIDIQLSSGEKIRMGHFDKINKEVFDAYKSGTALPAGTYLGQTGSKIGYTTNPHLHIESFDNNHTRDDILSLMKKKK
ncbi:polymorphic toxin-type HINT domain-containing protein [Leptospira meyeri]|uniref:polymorphic toxin-type HINT domain-containing protein n=1 Tax=Leptospira meyeri TaxID=29508 RepID=UPI0010829521|nr:polymorphic toxin-type HINT domain-containing protein [Leptospira meyeri]TGL11233.1 hypothetical protein EHQ50_15970 [Leptospira meyeri]